MSQNGDARWPDWRVRDTRLDCDLHGVVRTAEGPYAVGGDGTIAADAGAGWDAVVADGPPVEQDRRRAIDATDDGRRVWVVGADGTMACHDVPERRTYDFGYPADLAEGWTGVAVAGPRGSEKLLAAADDGRVLPVSVDGSDPEWGHLDRVANEDAGLAALASTPDGMGFAVDTAGNAYKTSADAGWQSIGVVAADTGFGDIDARADERVSVAGDDGRLYRYGTAYHSWTPIDVSDAGIRAVDALAGDDSARMTALAADGAVYERVAAERWEETPAPTDARLEDLAIGSVDVLVGENGVVAERAVGTASRGASARTRHEPNRVGRE